MVKDLQYFLDEEKKFCKEYSDYGELFYDESLEEMSVIGINDRLSFLLGRPFLKMSDCLQQTLGNEMEYNLSDIQRIILRLYQGRCSYIFRDDYYANGITDFTKNLFETLDDIIQMAPLFSGSKLYRFCHEYDEVNMVEGDEVFIPHNLTCTNEDWKQEDVKDVYIISPLDSGKTRAHNLFEIYNHGNENQVNFLRGTKFKVTKIEEQEESKHKKIFLDEIE